MAKCELQAGAPTLDAPEPTANGGAVGHAVRVAKGWRGLFGAADSLALEAGLFTAVQAVVRVGEGPQGKDGEALSAAGTESAADPDPIVMGVVRLFAPLAVADDGVFAAQGAPTRQPRDRHHPGSDLFSEAGSAIKRITVGVKALPPALLAKKRAGVEAFTLLSFSIPNEKRIRLSKR